MAWFDQGLLQRILLKLEASEESIYGPHAVYFFYLMPFCFISILSLGPIVAIWSL